MKKLAVLLSLTIITSVMFSACSLLQREEVVDPVDMEENGTAVDLSVEIVPVDDDVEEDLSVSIPLAVNIQ
jgi:ribonuclease PH